MYFYVSRVCLFVGDLVVCLFVAIKPENPYFATRPGLKVNPLGIYPLGPRSSSCGPKKRYTIAQKHFTCQLRSTLYKLTGWLASLDLRKSYTYVSSATE